MEQKEKKKKSNFWVLIAAVTSAIKLFDSDGGLFIVLIIVIIGMVIYGLQKVSKKANGNDQTQQSEQRGYQRDTPGLAAQLNRQKAQDFKTRANQYNQAKKQHVYRPNELNGRIEELKDLLEAGIIDRAEYNDRMAEIQAQMR